MLRQAHGQTLTVTSAAALIRNTSIFESAGFYSAIKIVATCGTPACPSFINVLQTKSVANCGTGTPTYRQVSGLRQLMARSMHSSGITSFRLSMSFAENMERC
jgi:hypothetical protein